MKTRNQIKQEEEKMIAEFTQKSFEESSKAWLTNKEKYGQSMYRYKREAFQEPALVHCVNQTVNQTVHLRRSKRLLEKAGRV